MLAPSFEELFKKEKDVSIKQALSDLPAMPEDATEFLRNSRFAALKDAIFPVQPLPKKPLFLMDLFTGKKKKN